MKMPKSLWILSGALLLTGTMSLPAAAQDNAPPSPNPPQRDAQPMPPMPPLRRTDSNRETDSYRLAYTLTESVDGKRMGVQHEELVVATNAPQSEVNLGTRVPVATAGDSALKNVQFQYLDIGLSINARIHTFTNGIQLSTRVEQSSIDDTQKSQLSQTPVIRHATLQTTVKMVENMPVVLGSLDLPGSNHRLQVEVVMTRLQ